MDYDKAFTSGYGPDMGRGSLRTRYDYAGAQNQTNIGWEVLPGAAWSSEDLFEAYLHAFMSIHNARKENDWEAYHRLLTDYISTSIKGGRSFIKSQCRRAVLLGYLKTYEVITGSTCFSCNHCVPQEDFTQFTKEQREAAVVRMAAEISTRLEEFESYAETLPDIGMVTDLLEAIRQEEARGYSLKAYVRGWTGRLLQDTPDHRAALLVRLQTIIVDQMIESSADEFIACAEHLARVCTDEELHPIWSLLQDTHLQVPAEFRMSIVQAEICHRLGFDELEEQARVRVESYANKAGKVDSELLASNYGRLAEDLC